MPPLFRALLVGLMTASLWAAVPVPPSVADEPTFRAGKKCTIVGTRGPDRLVGTGRSDVICGLGGDDTILGRGGKDLILAGGGDDTVRSGPGPDTVLGAGGADVIAGDGGQDALEGGGGADELSGGDGQDDLDGDGGDDELDGGPQPDDLDGGSGLNTCVISSDDEALRCAYDLLPPSVVDLEQSVDAVDVSTAGTRVTIRVRARDDIGVAAVFVTLRHRGGRASYSSTDSRLVAGTVRDGWWEGTVSIPRYAPSGAYSYTVGLYDQFDRWVTGDDVRGLDLQVTSIDDVETPVFASMSEPQPSTVLDVRTSGAQLRVTGRITDNLSGVGAASVCASPVNNYLPSPWCAEFERISGTLLDGIWTADIAIPRGSMTDQWKLWIDLRDRANPEALSGYYPDLEPWGPHIAPAGYGVFDVLGSDPPPPQQRPEVSSIELTPTTVDTLTRSATVTGTVTFDDPDGALVGAELSLHQTRPGGYTDIRYDGTLSRLPNGSWRGSVTLPRGAPPGQYQAYVNARVHDQGHIRYLDAYITVVDSSAR